MYTSTRNFSQTSTKPNETFGSNNNHNSFKQTKNFPDFDHIDYNLFPKQPKVIL
jgi:hypothetical protein